MANSVINGAGRAVSNGDTKQRMMKEVAKRPSDRGALSFGYFSLCKQRKVTRPRGAKPSTKHRTPKKLKNNPNCQLKLVFIVLYFTTTLHENHRSVRTAMLNLRPHHRIHIPNGLAVVAVLLLLIVSAANFVSMNGGVSQGQDSSISTSAEVMSSDKVIKASGKKSRGLNLGLMLFRRG